MKIMRWQKSKGKESAVMKMGSRVRVAVTLYFFKKGFLVVTCKSEVTWKELD